jgi:hypothetical protein
MWRLLSDTTSEDISSQIIMSFDPQHVYGYDGGSELAIPWDALFGLGPGLIPAYTKIGVVASVCWDPEPDGELGGDSAPSNISAALPAIDNFAEIEVDSDGDGIPDPCECCEASVPEGDIPLKTQVLSAYPSPARSLARVPVTLGAPLAGGRQHYDVRAEVFDIAGRSVSTVFAGSLPAGRHVLGWDGRTASGPVAGAGIYFMRVTVDGRVAGTVKLVRIP